MFRTTSNLKTLRDALSSHLELSEYFLGIHAFFDGEVIFVRNVVHVNMDLSPFLLKCHSAHPVVLAR